jgi:transcriptional regulator with XRE-family HTH domain
MKRRRYANLAAWLEGTGTTQLALAKRLGVSDVAVSYFVRRMRTPRAGLMRRIVKITGVPIESLLREERSERAA